MTMTTNIETAEKRYQATLVEWDSYYEEYVATDEELAGPDSRYGLDGWDSMAEFRTWLEAQDSVGDFFLYDMFTEDHELICGTEYPEVTFMTLDEDRWIAFGVPRIGF